MRISQQIFVNLIIVYCILTHLGIDNSKLMTAESAK